jgi:hypothetical protein
MGEIYVGKSTVETNEVVANEVQEVAAKPKRSRAKAKKTAEQIINEVTALRNTVTELEGAIAGVDHNNVVFGIVNESLEAKRAELEKVLGATYTVN